MATNERSTSASSVSVAVPGDVVGGIVLALAGLLHLFVLEVGGAVGLVVLLAVWPLLAAAVGAGFDRTIRPDRTRELPLVGAVSGVFGAALTAALVLVAGIAGAWSAFIFDTFGVEVVPVTIGLAIVLTICWTVAGYVGGYAVRTVLG